MRELIDTIADWDSPFALATIVETWRSAPRGPGAALAVDHEGVVAGSLSVGCIESDVYERCRSTLRTGISELVRYGVSDDDAFEIGTTCGGEIEVFIERVSPATLDLAWLRREVRAKRPVGLATIVEGIDAGVHILMADGEPIDTHLPARVISLLRAEFSESSLCDGATTTQMVDGDSRRSRILIHCFLPPPRLLIFGAVDFAAKLASAGKLLGYQVILCDARPIFALPHRFPDADEVIVEWPHKFLARTGADARTAICVLTHDPKFDEPLLFQAVQTSAGYIGAMGSRRTHEKRHARLKAGGMNDSQLDRIFSPIGLDLGGRTPAETAIAIVAEIIRVRYEGSAIGLKQRTGPIHSESVCVSNSITLSELALSGPTCRSDGRGAAAVAGH